MDLGTKIALIASASLILTIALGWMITMYLGIRELRRLGLDAFEHWKDGYAKRNDNALREMRELAESALRMNKATNVHEAAQVEMSLKREAENLKQATKALDTAVEPKIPVRKPRIVKDVSGRSFDMDDLEAL